MFSRLGLAFACLVLTALCAATAQQKHPAEAKGLKSTEEKAETFVTFVNKTGMTVQVWWLDFEGKRILYNTLAPDEEYRQQTYLTHPWIITDVKGNALQLVMPEPKPKTVRIGRQG